LSQLLSSLQIKLEYQIYPNLINQTTEKINKMAGDLVFITGATGHVGYRVLVEALSAGYSVRAAVRSQAKADSILNAPSVKALNPGSKLTFATIPDMLAKGAYDEAVKGVKYIIHLSSPITSGLTAEEFESKLILPALHGTIGILESANKTTGIERVVITSSEVAIIPWSDFLFVETGKTFDESYEIPFPEGPYGHEFEAYAASKVRALVATKEFIADKKPAFNVINMMPSFVIGKNELITDPKDITKGTNGSAFSQVLGVKSDFPNPSTTIYVNDIARLHVLALDPKIAGNQSFLANSEGLEGTTWGDAIDIVAKHFPEAVKSGVLPNNGSQPTKRTRIDVSKAEKTFGIKFTSYEEQVRTVAKHYLDLVAVKN
jgi:nucleoside-diphosphate-sugar epimerase